MLTTLNQTQQLKYVLSIKCEYILCYVFNNNNHHKKNREMGGGGGSCGIFLDKL